MTSGLKKFSLLLWKNWVLQKRHKIQTVFEVILPLLFTIVLVAVRGIIDSEEIKQPTLFERFAPNDPSNTSIFFNANLVKRSDLIYYSPNTKLVNEIMDRFFDDSFRDLNANFSMKGFANEDELVENYKNTKREGTMDPVVVGIIFTNIRFNDPNDPEDPLPDHIKYTLRFPAKQKNGTSQFDNWNTGLNYPIFQNVGPREDDEPQGGRPGYFREGFLYVQQALDNAIIKTVSGDNASLEKYDLFMRRFPFPPYIDDIFIIALQNWLPLIFLLSFIYPVINITKSLVHEKERRLKESMKIMGLPNWLHWTAWFTKSFIFLVMSIILMTILIKVKWYGDGLAVLTNGNAFVIFIFFIIFGINAITFSFLISTFFSKANSAATAAGVFWFLTYFPFLFLEPRYMELTMNTKLTSSLLCNTGFALGCMVLARWEGTGAGIAFSTISSSVSPDDSLTLLHIMAILIFDSLLYFCLAIYIEGVWPGEFGVPLPWFFPFTKSYWFGTERHEGNSTKTKKVLEKGSNVDRSMFEAEPHGLNTGIKIEGLSKVFGKNKKMKIAVNKMELNMYENQITALLGHNGAGKTTTMSMLTGLFPSTSGRALINGYDTATNINAVRGSLGLCPQHDVLFDEMTCEEHLRFFGLMKGLQEDQVEKEVTRLLKALNLENKRTAQAQTLSGGMKRKLSVGIALCGGSKIVLLDEPTSGMDPGARRSTWDLLKAEKKNRTVLLSTHFMEEADLLGDRIAIMAEGEVQCCGSSLFLKKRYGGGYHLIIVKDHLCQVENITKILQRRIPEIQVEQNVGAELSYSLPDEKSHLFPEMFEELENRKKELGIDSYGASITTMEEVFMKVGKEAEIKRSETHASKPVNLSVEALQASGSQFKLYEKDDRNSGYKLVFQQLWAMIVKKCLYATRNKLLLTFQTIIPVAFLVIAMVIIKSYPAENSPPSLDITLEKLEKFGPTVTGISCSDNFPACDAYKKFSDSRTKVEDLGPKDFDSFILDTYERIGISEVNFKYVIGLESSLNSSSQKEQLTAVFNNDPFHGAPISLNFLSNALLRTVTNNANKQISITNHPFPFTEVDKANDQSSGFQVGSNIAFGMSFLAASFVVFLIKERVNSAKHLQMVSGVKFSIFWLANFLFDAINYIIPCIALIVVLVAFQMEDFTDASTLGYVFLLFMLFGFGAIPMMYLFSFWFTVPSGGFTKMILFNIFTGMATVIAISVLQTPELELVYVADALEWIFMLFPTYNLGMGVVQISTNRKLHKTCPLTLIILPRLCIDDEENFCCKKYPKEILGWEAVGIGRNVLYLVLTGVVYFTIIFLHEAKIFRSLLSGPENYKGSKDKKAETEDSDVVAENERIKNTNMTQLLKNENLIIKDLTKAYNAEMLALDKLSLGVEKGECFGLLGVNGAGKTTTFKMLTGDIPATSGDAFIYSKSIRTQIKEVQKNLGYCPQFDAIIEELTGRETIRLFARLRGVKENKIDGLVNSLSTNLLFTDHIDKRVGAYSGGNKRKLSTALALVGSPPMVFLDEPTTGMDPVARRHLWNAISNVRAEGTSIVLTSHSMEECEALCSRLAIMVNGKFRCLGSPQHLKSKFGEGYTLIAQMASIQEFGDEEHSWETELKPLKNFIEKAFPGCTLKDLHPGFVHYHITDRNVSWGKLFAQMEIAKTEFNLEAYSVGQTTLEQVFLNFTKAQKPED